MIAICHWIKCIDKPRDQVENIYEYQKLWKIRHLEKIKLTCSNSCQRSSKYNGSY